MTLIEELRYRGLLNEIDERGVERLNKGDMVVGYIGTDPTVASTITDENGNTEQISSLHLGHLCAFMIAKIFQKYGNKPILLVGSATSSLGDPSFRENARPMMSYEQIEKNAKNIKRQLEKLVDFDETKPNCAILVDNREWASNMNFLDFARDVCQYITVNYLLAKESMKKRLESGLTITELLYPILQSFDFVNLMEKYNCEFQFGGSDQQGTIMTSLELIRKKLGREAHFITCPLITDASGKKIGKTEGNASVFLDRRLTSSYKMYQYFLNASDDMSEKMIKIFSSKDVAEIESLIQKHKEKPQDRILQKAIAEEVVTLIHSREDYENAVKASNALFDKTIDSLKELDNNTFKEVFDGVQQFDVKLKDITEGINIVDFLSQTTSILSSKSNARKAMQNNAISINKEKISNLNYIINSDSIINGKYILVQNGKKNLTLVNVKS